jgi:hypothetical protein
VTVMMADRPDWCIQDREQGEMRALLVVYLAFLGSGGSLLAADSYVGTWKRNAAKSKPAPAKPGMAVKELTLVVQETGGRYEETETGTRERLSHCNS